MKIFVVASIQFLLCIGAGFAQVYMQTADTMMPGRSAFCLFVDQTEKGVTLSLAKHDRMRDQLPAELKTWLHSSQLRASRKETLAEVPTFGKILTMEDGRRDDPKRFERIGDNIRVTFWGEGGLDGDQWVFEPVRPLMAFGGGLRLVKSHEFEMTLQKNEAGKDELFLRSRHLGQLITPATIVADTATEAKVEFAGQTIRLTKGEDLSHFVMEYAGASYDLFGFYGRRDERRQVSFHDKTELDAAALFKQSLALTKYAPLRRQIRKAATVLEQHENYPMVTEGAKTSTEVFNRILAKHPELDASLVGGVKGAKVEAAKNPWAIVRITERGKHPGVLLFSRNLKIERMTEEELAKATATTKAVIFVQGIGPDNDSDLALGPGKWPFRGMMREDFNCEILYP